MSHYDYIIVGAGSAGCVLANRLSVDPKIRVCLLEAGGSNRSPLLHVPVGWAATFNNPSFDWSFETEPEPALNSRRIYWPRGKSLGGSSDQRHDLCPRCALDLQRSKPEQKVGHGKRCCPTTRKPNANRSTTTICTAPTATQAGRA